MSRPGKVRRYGRPASDRGNRATRPHIPSRIRSSRVRSMVAPDRSVALTQKGQCRACRRPSLCPLRRPCFSLGQHGDTDDQPGKPAPLRNRSRSPVAGVGSARHHRRRHRRREIAARRNPDRRHRSGRLCGAGSCVRPSDNLALRKVEPLPLACRGHRRQKKRPIIFMIDPS